MLAKTLIETIHGYPGSEAILPAGTVIEIEPANNLPSSSRIKWWASPAEGHPWNDELSEHSRCCGVGLEANEVELI